MVTSPGNAEISGANVALIVSALNSINLDAIAPATGNQPSAGAADNTATSSAPSRGRGVNLTLSSLISALQLTGVNVISPMEEIMDEEQAKADAQALLEAQEAKAIAAAQKLVAQRLQFIGTNKPVPSPWAAASQQAVGQGAHVSAIASTPQALAPAIVPQAPSVMVPAAIPATQAVSQLDSTQVNSSLSKESTSQSTDASGDSGITGFVCTSCHTYNKIKCATETVYCIIAGRAVGVFKGWHNVQPLVSGVPHACYKKYPTEAEAVTAFEDAQKAGYVVVLP